MKSMSIMLITKQLTIFLTCLLVVYAIPTNETNVRAGCTVTSFNDISSAVSSCSDITISGITVLGGKVIDLTKLQDGSTVTFDGHITFEYNEWDGPMVDIKGKGITIKGNQGHVLDGQGGLYWDGQGGHAGVKKPNFIRMATTGNSVAKDVNVLNCPHACVSIRDSQDFTVTNWNIDVSAGDELGVNTDGFGLLFSSNVHIENSVVWNQDDCVVINNGNDLYISGITCHNSHGLSISVGLDKTDASRNTLSGVTFSDCNLVNAANGLHIKTHSDGAGGYIKDITYKNLKLQDVYNFGIEIQEDYSDPGNPKPNVPITGLTLDNIQGTMNGKNSMPLYIVCADGGCSDWHFSGISISGNSKDSACNYTPSGFKC